MNLENKAYTTPYRGTSQWVVDDAPLLEWAREEGLAPCEAQIQALKQRIIPHQVPEEFLDPGLR